MSFLYRINKPEYLYQPSKLIKRVFSPGLPEDISIQSMPWGNKMKVNPKEVIGKSIYTLGLYELPLSELVWRALNHVDEFLDVGANIGYFSSIASGHNNFQGHIHAFEPHPKIRSLLTENKELWGQQDRVHIHEYALSDKEGETSLYIPQDFDNNEGIASLEQSENAKEMTIQTKTMDQMFMADKNYAIKIDTEGHEASVIAGASELLKSGKAKIIFFEEFEAYPCRSFTLLEESGYQIYRIDRSFFGPELKGLQEPVTSRQWEPTNYVAMKKDDKLWDSLHQKGWSIFG